MVVFLRGALVQIKMQRPQEQTLDQHARYQNREDLRETNTSLRCNVGVEVRETFAASMTYALGALGGRSHSRRFQWVAEMGKEARCISRQSVLFRPSTSALRCSGIWTESGATAARSLKRSQSTWVNRLPNLSAAELDSTFLRKMSACHAILECITEEVRSPRAPHPFAIT